MLQKLKFTRPLSLIMAILMVGLMVMTSSTAKVSAVGELSPRSLTLQGVGTVGGSQAAGTVNDLFNFTTATTGNVGSILFQYCTTAVGVVCTTPSGLDTTGATLSSTQVGATGFTINASSNGAPYITRGSVSVSASTPLAYTLLGVKNPTAANQTFYVRISTFASIDTTGSPTDSGNVAASTATQIALTGTMPESLVFCTGGTVGTTVGVPDCSTATSGAVNFNQLFSPTDTAIATSQMAASTNAGSGYAITVNGPTLSSGLNTILGMNSATTSTHGVSQFGLNLKQNTTPAVGTEVVPTSNSANYKGEATVGSGYDTANTFKFTTGDETADSGLGGAGGSDAQIFTASYIVNVPGSQPAGSYTTTLTYICTPTF